jgi:hypothetical protein
MEGMGDSVVTANDWVGIITITITVFALYSSALAWLVGQNSRLRAETKRDLERLEGRHGAEAAAVRADISARLDALETSAEKGLDKIQIHESKSRQDMTASLQSAILAIQQQVNQLRDGSATKPEIVAVEQRLAASLNEFKAESRTEFAKIGQKVDRLPAMEANMASVSRGIEKISASLSQRV